jgi:hypothetical protein
MIGAGAIWKGWTITAFCRTFFGRLMVLSNVPNNTTAATISGARTTERFSHSSRRTDQYSGRVESIGYSGIELI